MVKNHIKKGAESGKVIKNIGVLVLCGQLDVKGEIPKYATNLFTFSVDESKVQWESFLEEAGRAKVQAKPESQFILTVGMFYMIPFSFQTGYRLSHETSA